ncbi:MAG: sulfite oxidase-like oxidoreductase [Candidatus Cloacimonetes bacterium]|nr:sulfite oxidase-like oxidoreductase [Candidatus Cloacimonadota bacterium]
MKKIISDDTLKENRIPPNQKSVKKLPVLHYGPVPEFDESTWSLEICGVVKRSKTFSYQDILAMEKSEVFCDIHCVTTWSKLDTTWKGILVQDLMKQFEVLSTAKYVIIHAEFGFTTNMPIKDFLDSDVLLATELDGEQLSPKHGYPLRLVVPKLYFWKSAKWIRKIEFATENHRGFWERNGYHDHGDPWSEERQWK